MAKDSRCKGVRTQKYNFRFTDLVNSASVITLSNRPDESAAADVSFLFNPEWWLGKKEGELEALRVHAGDVNLTALATDISVDAPRNCDVGAREKGASKKGRNVAIAWGRVGGLGVAATGCCLTGDGSALSEAQLHIEKHWDILKNGDGIETDCIRGLITQPGHATKNS